MMIDLITKAKQFKHTSLEYVEHEDIIKAEVLVDNEEGLFLYTKTVEEVKIDWASNSPKALFEGLKSAVELLSHNQEIKTMHVEFIPEEIVNEMEGYGFKIFSEWLDHWKHNLEAFDVEVPESPLVRNIKDIEYQKASDITKLCKGLSRGYNGETAVWIREWNEKEDSCVFVAEIDKIIVGVCCVSLYGFSSDKGTVLWIREVAVDPNYHSKKVGLSLMLHAIAWGKQNGAKRSFLACDVDNSKAIKLYEGLGYERKAKRGQINMVKSINEK